MSKSAMVIASHLIEDLVSSAGGATILISGFQESRFWEVEETRYQALSLAATVVSAAGPGDAPPEPAARRGEQGSRPGGSPSFVALDRGDPLMDDWFVVAYGPGLALTLCGLDCGERGASLPDRARTFSALLTTEPRVAQDALAFLRGTFAGQLDADVMSRIGAALATPAVAGTAQAIIGDRLLSGMFGRVDSLRRAEHAAHRASSRLHEVALEAAARERHRLAEVLHDQSLQTLLAAGQDLEEVIAAREHEPPLERAREHLRDGVGFLRVTLSGMYEPGDPDEALPARLEAIGRDLVRRGGPSPELSVDPDVCGRADEQVVVFVREMLANVAKHAHADRVSVHVGLTADRRSVGVEVTDDGRPSAPRER